MENKKDGRGGKREGSGRKGFYGEKTKKIAFYLPESHIPRIKKIVESELSKLKITSKHKPQK